MSASDGLEGVVAAETVLSDVDGLAGRLVIRGHSLDEIAGRWTFEEAVTLLWDGFFETPPRNMQAALGAARVDAARELAALDGRLAERSPIEIMRALTARLAPLLRRADAPRVVNLSSGAHHMGRIDFDDLQARRRYRPWAAYGQSKLAMLIFSLELERRSVAAGWGIMACAAHPGYARTDLIASGPGVTSLASKFSIALQPLISQSAAEGALPTLFAATSPQAVGGGYYGPGGFLELTGPPKVARVAGRALDTGVARRLWEVSEALTGVGFG